MVMDCKNRTGAPPAMDTGDWRSQLQIDTRRTIVNLIMDALKRTLPSPGQKELQVLEQIARRFEENIYVAATSESDYLGKICLKLLAIETKSQNPLPNALISNSAGNSSSALGPGVAHSTQPQVKNQTQSIPVPLSAWQSQACPQFISPNIQNNLVSNGVQSSTSFPSATPPVSGLAQTPAPIVVGQDPDWQRISGISLDMVENVMGQRMRSKTIVNHLRQNLVRQQVVPHQQQQSQSLQQYLYDLRLESMQLQQPQNFQLQSHENQTNPLVQSMNLEGSISRMQQNNTLSMQHNLLLPGVLTSKQNMNLLHPGSISDSEQENMHHSLQQIVQSIQLTPASTSCVANINVSESGMNILQPDILFQSNTNVIHHHHPTQQQLKKMMHIQQLKRQFLQHQMQEQLLAQMETYKMTHLHQMNDANKLKLQQEMGVKSGVFQQDIAAGPCTAYSCQPIKSGLSFPVSSSQLLQDASPQLPQRSSPQSKQENLACSLTKTGTPLQSAKSPSVVPSSTPLAPSLLPRGKESRASAISSLSNAENIELLQTTGSHTSALSLAIHNPGISASSLPVELPSPDNGHDSPSVTVCGKSDVTEHPLDRLIKVVKCMSPQALSASISEIASVVSIIDRIAGSAPGNGSTAAVGEDLVAITNYRLHAREVMRQDGKGRKRKIGCFASVFPSSVAPSTDSSNQLTVPEAFELDSSARPSVKKPRIEANHARLVEIARALDDCAQQTQTGGGSFSSKYGTWENCASVA